MAKRFENRKSIVKGSFIDIDTQEFTPFEIETEYTRSIEKAVKLVKEMEGITDNNIVIAVSEIINEKPAAVKYNNGKVYELARATFPEKEEAEAEVAENETVIAIPWYEYEAQFWGYNSISNQYITDTVHDESPLSMTKTNMRQFLTNSAYNLCCYEIIGIHNAIKTETKWFCVIDNDELETCVEK